MIYVCIILFAFVCYFCWILIDEKYFNSGWKTAYLCVNCSREISDYTRMYSGGRCPLCGFKGESAGTIVDTKEKSYYLDHGKRMYK